VVSVDYHVAQYAKIVEDLKVEIQQLKDKIVPLEDENQALRNQVSVVKLPRSKKRGRWTLASIDSYVLPLNSVALVSCCLVITLKSSNVLYSSL